MDWLGLISLVISLALSAGIWFGKNWMAARIQRSVQHTFDEKIENLRSELREREAEIAALRSGALSGLAQRRALLDKRRIEAVDRFWAAFVALAPYRAAVIYTSIMKIDAIATEIGRNEKLQAFFKMMEKTYPELPKNANPAKLEQPYLSPLAWAYFSAYQTAMVSAYAVIKFLALGESPAKLLKLEGPRDLLKVTLPDWSDYIDKWGMNEHLLDELEKRLLAELNRMLEGADIDEASLALAAKINEQVKDVTAQRDEQEAQVKADAVGLPRS